MSTDVIDPPEPSPVSGSLVVVVLLGLVLLFTPAVAFVLGVRAEPIENRALADAPEPSDGWEVFPRATAWATDYLPLRKDAVEMNDALVERLFGQPPVQGGGGIGEAGATVGGAGSLDTLFPRVIEGDGDWLFYGGDVKGACLEDRPVGEVVDDLVHLHEIIEGSGRRLMFLVAPDKSTVLPEHLPDDFPGERCATSRKAAMREALARTPGGDEWIIDLRDHLLDRQAADGVPIYRKRDTHWTPRGGAVLGQELMKRLRPGMTSFDDVVATGERERRGDLAALLGRKDVDRYTVWELQRPGVRPPAEMPPAGPAPLRLGSTTDGAPLFEPPTLLIGDSFLAASRPLVYPLFADLTVLHTLDGAANPELLAAEVAAAEVVVIEVVERDLVAEPLDILSPQVRAAIEDALR